jgi:predicted nucleic acid-binding Zn ribbon protein
LRGGDSERSERSEPTRIGEPTPIGDALDRVLKGLGTPGLAASRTVFGDWEELVGPAYAAHARPVSLDHGCLLVAVEDPVWATRFRYEQAGLLDRFAADLGPGVVTRIDVRVSPR